MWNCRISPDIDMSITLHRKRLSWVSHFHIVWNNLVQHAFSKMWMKFSIWEKYYNQSALWSAIRVPNRPTNFRKRKRISQTFSVLVSKFSFLASFERKSSELISDTAGYCIVFHIRQEYTNIVALQAPKAISSYHIVDFSYVPYLKRRFRNKPHLKCIFSPG